MFRRIFDDDPNLHTTQSSAAPDDGKGTEVKIIVISAGAVLAALLACRIKIAIYRQNNSGRGDTVMSKWDNLFIIVYISLCFLMIPLVLIFFYLPCRLIKMFRTRQYRRRREKTVWKAPISDADFLRGCGIECNTPDAEITLMLRRELAGSVSTWIRRLNPEDIAPDMTCGELVYGWKPQMYCHDGIDSVGIESILRITRGHTLSKDILKQLIQPEKKPRITMKEFFRNYLDVWKAYHHVNGQGTDE